MAEFMAHMAEVFEAMQSEYAMAHVYPYWVVFFVIVLAFLAIDTHGNRR